MRPVARLGMVRQLAVVVCRFRGGESEPEQPLERKCPSHRCEAPQLLQTNHREVDTGPCWAMQVGRVSAMGYNTCSSRGNLDSGVWGVSWPGRRSLLSKTAQSS